MIQIQTLDDKWINTKYQQQTALASVLAIEVDAIAARRMNNIGEVLQLLQASVGRVDKLKAEETKRLFQRYGQAKRRIRKKRAMELVEGKIET